MPSQQDLTDSRFPVPEAALLSRLTLHSLQQRPLNWLSTKLRLGWNPPEGNRCSYFQEGTGSLRLDTSLGHIFTTGHHFSIGQRAIC